MNWFLTFAAVTSLTAAAALPAAATVYDFTFTNGDGVIDAHGQLDVSGTDVTGGSGVALGAAMTIFPNFVNGGGAVGSPSGAFIYDNELFVSSSPQITNAGLLFTQIVGGEEVNIFSNGGAPGTDQLYFQSGVNEFGTFAIAAPEPAAWALMLIGVGALGGALRTQRRTASLQAV